MTRPTNFADPDFEPSDDELAELMHEAFAGLAEARAQSDRELRARIAAAQRQAVRALLDERHKGRSG